MQIYQYCTIQEIKDYLMESGSEYDSRYRLAIRQISGAINRIVHPRFFAPFYGSQSLEIEGLGIGKILDCLSLVSVVDENSTALTDYSLDGRLIRFAESKPLRVTATGIFGHCDIEAAGTVTADNGSTLTLTAAPVAESYLVIGSEIVFVDSVSGSVATVQRAVNGSTQATQTGKTVNRVYMNAGVSMLAMNAAIRMLTVPQNRMNLNLESNGILTPSMISAIAEYRPEFL